MILTFFKSKNKFLYIFTSMILAFVMAVVCLYPLTIKTVRADDSEEVTNLVIFVKKQSDSRDIFNAEFDAGYTTYRNWNNIKQMYNGGTKDYEYDNSFSNYIYTISEGKVRVHNIFPQEYEENGLKKVKTYVLNADSYSTSSAIVTEIIAAIKSGSIDLSSCSSETLDHLNNGILDNLTIVMQGNDYNGKTEAFHEYYSGNDLGIDYFQFGGKSIKVGDYNAIPSSWLVKDDASISVSSQQGVIAHEFLHSLDFPDLYRYSSGGEPVGMWDVMAANTFVLQYPLGYLRAQKSWISSKEISTSGRYTLTAVSESGGDKLFVLKTPMAESESELICVEYRKKQEKFFDHSVPSTGIIVYRVNRSVDPPTNAAGKNFIYVYRPGITDPESATDKYLPEGGTDYVNRSRLAAINPELGRSEYGTTNLGDTFKNNTIYFSNGANSGIRISNLSFSSDYNQVTFDIKFADYSNSGVLDTLGIHVADNAAGTSDASIYTDPNTGKIYVVYLNNNYDIVVKVWDETNSKWNQIGSFNTNYFGAMPQIAVYSGNLYLLYSKSNSNLEYRSYTNGNWSNPVSLGVAKTPSSLQLVTDSSGIYCAYTENSTRFIIKNLLNNTVVTNGLTAGCFSNPSLSKIGSKFYVAYSDFPNGNARIDVYDMSRNMWNNIQYFDGLRGSNNHILQNDNNVLYANVGLPNNNKNLAFAYYDKNGWSKFEIPDSQNFFASDLDIINNLAYVSYHDNVANKIIIYKQINSTGGMEKYYEMSCSPLCLYETAHYGNNIYLLTQASGSSIISVRKIAATQSGTAHTPIETPTVTPPTVTPVDPVTPVTPPETPPAKLPFQDEVETKIGVDGFVFRLYAYALTRKPDDDGFQYWKKILTNKEISGTEAAYGFFFSPEMKARNLSDEDFIELLYLVMLNRYSDNAGKEYWLECIRNGMSRVGIFNGFANSKEYTSICSSYGINRGNPVPGEVRDKNYGLSSFVSRLYTKALGRPYDEDGLNYWCGTVLENRYSLIDVSTGGFFHSKEFLDKDLNNEEYVKVLYRTFLGREYDQEGLEYWLNQLNSGIKTKDQILEDFAYSQEFSNIMRKYGL